MNQENVSIEGFLRVNQIIPSIIPISRSSWYAGVKDGRYPKPVKLGLRTTVWRVREIRELVEGSLTGLDNPPTVAS